MFFFLQNVFLLLSFFIFCNLKRKPVEKFGFLTYLSQRVKTLNVCDQIIAIVCKRKTVFGCTIHSFEKISPKLFHVVGKVKEISKQHKEDQNAGKKGSSINGEKGLNTESDEKEDEKKDEQDVVFVQDVGFTIKITAPGVEPFDIQVLLIQC